MEGRSATKEFLAKCSVTSDRAIPAPVGIALSGLAVNSGEMAMAAALVGVADLSRLTSLITLSSPGPGMNCIA